MILVCVPQTTRYNDFMMFVKTQTMVTLNMTK